MTEMQRKAENSNLEDTLCMDIKAQVSTHEIYASLLKKLIGFIINFSKNQIGILPHADYKT